MRSPVNNQIQTPNPVRFTFDFPSGAWRDRYINLRIAKDAAYTDGVQTFGFIRDTVREIALDTDTVYYWSFIWVCTPQVGAQYIGSENGAGNFSTTWIFRTNASGIPQPVIVPPTPGILPGTTTPPTTGTPPTHEPTTLETATTFVTSTTGLVIAGIVAAFLVWYFYFRK
jgi:hypothetical protein